MLLWQEYRASAPEGYGYSRFCELYDEWESRLSPTMRQVHPAGERLFVDYAGQTVDLIDGRTGEVRSVQVFVAVLGASSYTYAEATFTQTLPDWIGAHAGGYRKGDLRGIAFATTRLAAGSSALRDMIMDAWTDGATTPVGYPMVNVRDIESGKVRATRDLFGAD
jgi:hypothetical protein